MSKETEDRIAKLRQRVREDLQEIKAISTGCGSWFEVAGESVRCGEGEGLCPSCQPQVEIEVASVDSLSEAEKAARVSPAITVTVPGGLIFEDMEEIGAQGDMPGIDADIEDSNGNAGDPRDGW